MVGNTAHLNKVVRIGLIEETSEPRLKGNKRISPADI